jgi:NADH-quinone oxidoreductase subunit L
MTVPLIVLAALAAVGGLYLQGALPAYLQPVLGHHLHEHHESIFEAIAHSWIGIAGVGLGILLYTQLAAWPGRIFRSSGVFGKLSEGKWFVDEVYDVLIVRPLERIAYFLWKWVDQGVVDGAVNGTAAVVDVNGEIARLTQTGQVRHYAFLMLLGTIVLTVFYLIG